MAHQSVPAFNSHVHPTFAQLLDNLLNAQIAHVNRTLSLCTHESPESHVGACDGGFPCHDQATVCELTSGQELCLTHFQEVKRG